MNVICATASAPHPHATPAPNSRRRSKVKSTDEDGFTIVTSKRKNRRPTTTGTKTSFDGISFKSAERCTDLYIGRCAEDTTEDQLVQYVKSVVSVTPRGCQQIQTKVPFSSAFKLTINANDKHELFKSEFWPKGVIIKPSLL